MSSNYLQKPSNIKYTDQNMYNNRKNINLEKNKRLYKKKKAGQVA